jgi:hypothetical protein
METVTTPWDTPVLLIAALIVLALLAFAVLRKITKLIILAIALGVIVVGLYLARAEGFVTW